MFGSVEILRHCFQGDWELNVVGGWWMVVDGGLGGASLEELRSYRDVPNYGVLVVTK